MNGLLLGVDIGTTSSKGVLVRPDGNIIARSVREHTLSLPQPGWAEHDAEQIWWTDFQQICRELTAQTSEAILAVCVSGIGPCLLAADEQGHPLRPAILYGIDTRATQEIAEQNAQFGEENILKRCGSPLTSQAIGPKLLWLRRHEPQVWQQTRKFFMASSFLVYRLTGEYILDHHSASQCDPLYDVIHNAWIEEWASDICPSLPLPRLLWPTEIAGTVTAHAASLTGLLAGTPVVAGTIDAWAESLSVGVRARGDMMLMYGTTMFMVEVQDRANIHPRLWSTVGVFPGSHTLAAGMATSGALTGWFKQLVGDMPYEKLLEEAAKVPAGADGLVILPYFAGERTPLFDPQARGVICGLTLRHERGHLYRALLEATAYGVRHILDVMHEASGGDKRLVAVGGGTQGGLWTQIVSDVIGLRQELPQHTIGASYGDAFMAAVALNLVKPDTQWNPIARVVEPDSQVHKRYSALYDIYRQLYPATLPQTHQLAILQEGDGATI